MNDKEMLELAAKAAGLAVEWSELYQRFERFVGGTYMDAWDPLTDDGDALRLAVKLDMMIDGQGAWICVEVMGESVREDARQDPHAATRRAIVRAAAAIGEKL